MNDTQQKLIDSFKDLMLDYPFKKITIKMITDGAGVIRPTFYRHFQDKYELFNVILDEELFDTLHDLLAVDLYQESLTMIFTYFDKNHVFHQKAFEVDGQDSFYELLVSKFTELFEHMIETQKLKIKDAAKIFTSHQLSILFSISLVTVLNIWIDNYDKIDRSPDELVDFYIFVVSHDINDVFEKE